MSKILFNKFEGLGWIWLLKCFVAKEIITMKIKDPPNGKDISNLSDWALYPEHMKNLHFNNKDKYLRTHV